MLMKTKSIDDRQLLWLTGFLSSQITDKGVSSEPDIGKICSFFLVAPQTARRWLRNGFPPKARHQLEMIYAGDSLPFTWRKAGLKVCEDGVLLPSGHLVRLASIQFWQFIMPAVNWQNVPPLVTHKII